MEQSPLVRGLFATLFLSANVLFAQQPPKPAPPAPSTLPAGWEEIDERLVFLTVQLSTVESTIDATNKALKVNGYQQKIRQDAADRAQKGNEIMDRNGGGPVRWQEFYGKTAEKFFYHPTDGTTVYINPDAVPQRPPQFDYIYRANLRSQLQAVDDTARIGNKIDDLLDYRRKLESDQNALWAKIAFRGDSSLDLPSRTLYRLDLTGGSPDDAGKQSIEAVRAGVQFMLAIDAELAQAQKNLDGDQKDVLDHLSQVTEIARADLQARLLRLPSIADKLADARSPLGRFSRSAKRLGDSAQNMVDAYKLAWDCDGRDDQAGKQSYRGQFQQMVFDYASTVVTADQALSQAALEWKVVPTTKTPEPSRPPITTGDNPEAIAGALDAAKAAHEKEITAARHALVAAIDAQLNTAADAGDLEQVTALQAARARAAKDGSLPEEMKNATVLSARMQMNTAVQQADERLVTAYRDAVRAFTRARRIAEAQATQDEFNASGLKAPVEEHGAIPSPSLPSTDSHPGSMATGGGGLAGGPTAAWAPPTVPDGKLEIQLPAPVEHDTVGGGGRYLVFHLSKLQQLAIFDVSQLKIVKYIPLPTNDVVFACGAKKLFVGLKDLRQIQRWDLTRMELELTVPAPEGGISAIAIGANSIGPVLMLGDKKRFWAVNPATLKAEKYPSKNWGTEGSAWGPTHIHVSFDGTTAVACGGGWAGIELSHLAAGQAIDVEAGSYVNGDTLVSGNGALVFPEGGGILHSDLQSKVTGIEGHPFPADDSAFSLAIRKEKKSPATVVLFSNADARPLVTLRDLTELGKESKLAAWERIHLIPLAKVLITVGEGNDRLVVRKFDMAEELEAEGIDYLFVESAPISTAERGARYAYQMQVRSKKGGVKTELQSGPKGMTVSKDGLIQWMVPRRFEDAHPTVIVQISDASGQTIFHTFTIAVGDTVIRR